MTMKTEVRLSALVVDQLYDLPLSLRQKLFNQIKRLEVFPESASTLSDESHSQFRQLVINRHRIIYRYFMDENEVRIYCVIHERRQLPSAEFLTHLQF